MTPSLERLRAEQLRWMPETVAILRKVDTADAAGGQIDTTYATVATTKGRLAGTNKTVQERVFAERLGLAAPYLVSMPYGTDVKLSDRLLIGGTRTMEVTAILDESYNTVTYAICSEVV